MSDQLRLEDEELPITLRRAWDRALRLLSQRVPTPAFESHIRKVRLLELELDASPVRVVLGAPAAFTREWVERRYRTEIAHVLEDVVSAPVVVEFVVRKDAPAPTTVEGSSVETLPAKPKARRTGSAGVPEPAPVASAFPTRYSFEHFVVGPSNRLAHGGAKAVAGEPGQRFNPLFLYGPSGTGKTHLLMAIGAEAERSGIRCAYVSGEDFTTEFVSSLRDRKTEAFRRKWRTVDLLLMDDIQFIAGKEATKEEFFHTYNALTQAGRQVVLAADRAPRDLQAIDARLRSRFESGLMADLNPPDFETRLAILKARCVAERIRMQDDVLEMIATLVPSNVRTLEGALTNLVASTSLFGETPTVDRTREILERYLGPACPMPGSGGRRPAGTRITSDLIQQVVAERFALPVDQLTGKRRDREIAQARHIAMHLARELTGASLLSIGQAFGGRDHSTVAHACDRIRSQAGSDTQVQLLLDGIVDELRARSESR